MTYGQKTTTSNPNLTEEDLNDVARCREAFAELIDAMVYIRDNAKTQEKKWQCTLAIAKLESAQMKMVKAVTFIDKND